MYVVVWAQRKHNLRVDVSCAQLLGDQQLVDSLVDGSEDVGGRDNLRVRSAGCGWVRRRGRGYGAGIDKRVLKVGVASQQLVAQLVGIGDSGEELDVHRVRRADVLELEGAEGHG